MKNATKEHYKILQVDEKADLEQIKKAYRKRAFELHPDLNPNNPDAHKLFQHLNEAYVILIAQANTQKVKSKQASDSYKAQASASSSTSASSAKASTSSQSTSSSQSAKKEEAKTENKKEYQKTESHKRTYSKSSDDVRKKAQSAYTKEGNKAQSRVFNQKEEATKTDQEEYKAPTKEDVLKDILSDPFARRVYEDIYSSIKQNPKQKEEKKKKKESVFSKITPDWNAKSQTVKVDDGLSSYMKAWMRKQIDDTLEFRLPITSLFPGSRIRLQIAQGLAKETRTVDLTLPRDFVIGKPVKLAGMGKKIGKWQGDLFITLLPILPESK